MLSLSFTEPPGWMIAVIPAAAAASRRYRRMGRTRPMPTRFPSTFSPAFFTAISTETTRDSSAPRPRRRLAGHRGDEPLGSPSTMAFDFTCLQTNHAKCNAPRILLRLAARFVTHFHFVRLVRANIACLHEQARHRRGGSPSPCAKTGQRSPVFNSRTFSFHFLSTSSACGS